jgi:S1-C subfamily serine protease
VVAPGVVDTNAHGVAWGERNRERNSGGRLVGARLVTFDDNRDLAVLEVPGLDAAPLTIGAATEGMQGAVLGYPGGQNTVRVAPAGVRRAQAAVGRGIYGADRPQRLVLVLAAALRPGDSGSALIDTAGKVVGVAFAIAPDRPGTSYALADVELRAVLAEPRSATAGGPCI